MDYCQKRPMQLLLSISPSSATVRRLEVRLRSRGDDLDARAVYFPMYENSTFNPSCRRLIPRLDGTRDLVDMIMNPVVYHEADRFSYLLEHSLLLGDVSLASPDSNLQANPSGSTYHPLS